MPYRDIADLPKPQTDQYSRHQKEAFLKAFNKRLRGIRSRREPRVCRRASRGQAGRRKKPKVHGTDAGIHPQLFSAACFKEANSDDDAQDFSGAIGWRHRSGARVPAFGQADNTNSLTAPDWVP